MTTTREYKYLLNINSPAGLRTLTPEQLAELCSEIRHFMVNELSVNPGHLGASLGAVEMTVALHYVYDTPFDQIVWDVGHQAYAHKIITGRRDVFHTNRKMGGIGGFPRRAESEYDSFVGGHASVSISAALGMAQASSIKGDKRNVVAIIGDGAMTGGLAFEGLNNAGASNADILVILNDNQMSISPNVGAMTDYLLNMTISKRYNRWKDSIWNRMEVFPRMRRMMQNAGKVIKQSLLKESNMFESLHFRYFGPVDGNDMGWMIKVLTELKDIQGPKLLHVLTVKGKGYEPAEKDQATWHAPGRFDPVTGEILCDPEGVPYKYQDVFGHTLVELAKRDSRVVGITPAMLTGCSMDLLNDQMPERCFDVGIAEGHAVTFSAGLATQGLVPFVNIYSSFMQRAYDMVIHDVALQNLGVVMCLDRAGIVGEDGATHHGVFDMVYLRTIPNLTIAAPMNEAELRGLMYTALNAGTPFAIRYPRGRGEGVDWQGEVEIPKIGHGRMLRKGNDIAVISIGTVGNNATRAIERAEADGISVEHIDLRFVKPLDEDLLHEAGRKFRRIITVEDGALEGGVGSAVLEFMNDNGYDCRIKRLGIGDNFVEHGTISELQHLCGYDAEGIYRAIKDFAGK